jgi:hypothetical protein
LIDYAGSTEEALKTTWKIATEGDSGVRGRTLESGALKGIPRETDLPAAGDPATDAARKAILDCVQASCGTSLADALAVQTKHSAGFMTTEHCRRGRVGEERARTMVD